MQTDTKNPQGNEVNTMLCAVKLLVKDSTFWWNLIPAIAITTMFILFKRDVLSYIVGCIGVLNWGIVIAMFVKSLKH